MNDGRPTVGLIMTGGGARAAYQVGVLRALAELLPADVHTPFPIICGTSAGAINAAVLAMNAGDFRRGVRRLMAVWKNFRVHHVYRADPWGAISNSARWIYTVLTGGAFDNRPVSLLDNAPLAVLLGRQLDFPAIQSAIDGGHLAAFSVTCSGYTSGQSVTFFQGVSSLQPWQRARRIGVPMPITLEHLLASSALPFIFPPVHINREYFGDGSMRQIAPVSPALHLGADRVLIVGTGRQTTDDARARSNTYPSLAQIAGHALNSIFLDSLAVDIERLERINRTVKLIPPDKLADSAVQLRAVKVLFISPSQPIERIASRFIHELPRTVRFVLRPTGALNRSGSNLASYLLFEESFCRALIDLGYKDTVAREAEVREFFGLEESRAHA